MGEGISAFGKVQPTGRKAAAEALVGVGVVGVPKGFLVLVVLVGGLELDEERPHLGCLLARLGLCGLRRLPRKALLGGGGEGEAGVPHLVRLELGEDGVDVLEDADDGLCRRRSCKQGRVKEEETGEAGKAEPVTVTVPVVWMRRTALGSVERQMRPTMSSGSYWVTAG